MNGERKLAMFMDFENIARGVKEAQYKQFELKLVLEQGGVAGEPPQVLRRRRRLAQGLARQELAVDQFQGVLGFGGQGMSIQVADAPVNAPCFSLAHRILCVLHRGLCLRCHAVRDLPLVTAFLRRPGTIPDQQLTQRSRCSKHTH